MAGIFPRIVWENLDDACGVTDWFLRNIKVINFKLGTISPCAICGAALGMKRKGAVPCFPISVWCNVNGWLGMINSEK